MAEERTLGLARARDVAEEDLSKEELQQRMEEARDSITQTVTEIKETVVHQYENVKDALDWREQFKKRPVAWSLGAAGVGFCVGYCIAATVKSEDSDSASYGRSERRLYAGEAITGRSSTSAAASFETPNKANGKDEGPGLISRFKETRAFDRLQEEVGTLGNRLVEELSTTAQTVVLPALIRKVRDLIGADLSDGNAAQPAASMRPNTGGYKPELERNSN